MPDVMAIMQLFEGGGGVLPPASGFDVGAVLTQALSVATKVIEFVQGNELMGMMLGFSLVPLGFKVLKGGKKAAAR